MKKPENTATIFSGSSLFTHIKAFKIQNSAPNLESQTPHQK
ncbi:hypothetical protein C427_0180 [Paraglaciecola psychrophila 170]|uniref:Uncharacterized protein n=1 Tax=Paraglaciecola psychrophila 170 TaxID=1129794 RepID=K7A664_9ALTE|nr:hypothetical protein C427_0180 [Paraglaciecola psychrophila 170]GAC37822.1 hypothetical protein GPSY_2201 [Paraglaciecola psychrophila 170]